MVSTKTPRLSNLAVVAIELINTLQAIICAEGTAVVFQRKTNTLFPSTGPLKRA